VSTNAILDIVVNGEPHRTGEGQTVLGLIEQLGLDPAQVAVELDRRIVKQPLWGTTPLGHGSQLEIVQFVGGG
jgi:thiamine biosynthesis protein ThiS